MDDSRNGGQPGGRSATAAQFGDRTKATETGAKPVSEADRVEERQRQPTEPTRAKTTPVARADDPNQTPVAKPKLPDDSPPKPPESIVPPSTPTPPVPGQPPSKRPPLTGSRIAASFAPRASRTITALAAVPRVAAFAGGAAAVAVGSVIAGGFAAKKLGDSVEKSIGEFSPAVAATRAHFEAVRVNQAVRLAGEVGPGIARFEGLKSILSLVLTEGNAKLFEQIQPFIEESAKSLITLVGFVTDQVEIAKQINDNLDRILDEAEKGNSESLFNRKHLEPPFAFTGDVIGTSNTPGQSPPGMELQ